MYYGYKRKTFIFYNIITIVYYNQGYIDNKKDATL